MSKEQFDKDTLCKIALFADLFSVEKMKRNNDYNDFWRRLHFFIQNEITERGLGDYYYDNYFFENIVKEHHTSEEIEEKYPLDGGYGGVILGYCMERKFK